MAKARKSRRLVVNMISESEFTVQGHGVHTAYKEITNALRRREDVDVKVNTDRPADIIHIQTVGIYALRQLLKKGGKKVISAHLVPDSFVGSLRGAKYWKWAGRGWLKFFYSRADLVLACSGMVRDELENDMKLGNVELLYNTVDMMQYQISDRDRIEARSVLGLNKKDFVVIGNGQVQPRKRLDTFFAIAREFPDVKFFWVGGIPFKHMGAEYTKMQKMIDSAPDNVVITGVIPLSEVRKYYAAADVFVLPAMQENHPMCVLEAAGAGLPIILRDIPQYNDTFRGHALMASSDEDFIELVRLLMRDKKAYEEAKIGAAGIASRFDSSTGATQAVEFYSKLLDGKIGG